MRINKLSSATVSQKQDILNKTDLAKLPLLNVSVLRNVMVEPLETILRYGMYTERCNGRISFGGFDTIYQEAVGGSDLLNGETSAVLVFMYLPQESPQLSLRFASLASGEIREESERIIQKAAAIVSGIRGQTSAMILWHAFEYPAYPALGIYDNQTSEGQLATVQRLNAGVLEILSRTKTAYMVDTNLCLLRTGAHQFYDQRYWHRSRLPYSLQALEAICEEDIKFLRTLVGRSRKCLVLDCDNTLWGGVIGEDGLSGIKLGTTHPGSSFQEFQKELVNLYHRGVLLALCSKNNEDDVWEVFDKHPDMVLKREHIAAAQINWQDKIVNIKRIASELNIGLDSMVFIDDSPFEVELIRDLVPDVDVLQIPNELAFGAREVLARYGKFDTPTLSDEDRQRGAMYRAEAGRRKLEAGATDMSSYLRSLQMEVSIRVADDFTVSRIAQLTQKTNQFNLTTRRYSEADIQRFMDSADHAVFSLSLSDMWGDSGCVGACIVRIAGGDMVIDTFLLSCRVLGRDVECALLLEILRWAKQRGANQVLGQFVKTSKNAQTELFFSKHGFAEIESLPGTDKTYVFSMTREIPAFPDHFKSISAMEGRAND